MQKSVLEYREEEGEEEHMKRARYLAPIAVLYFDILVKYAYHLNTAGQASPRGSQGREKDVSSQYCGAS